MAALSCLWFLIVACLYACFVLVGRMFVILPVTSDSRPQACQKEEGKPDLV